MRKLLLLVLLAAACGIPDENPAMQPGQDCFQCHGRTAQAWSAAGTVFGAADSATTAGVSGAKIFLTDADGRAFTLTSNSSGNFYTAEPLKFPLRVQAEANGVRMAMSTAVNSGSCNSCHAQPPQNDALGRLFVPAPPATAR
jgi:hypothetical protein